MGLRPRRILIEVLVVLAFLTAATSNADINKDGRPDVLWHNPTSGEVSAWPKVFIGLSLVVAAVVAANAMDSASSWQRLEANPFLATPGAQFGKRQILIKAGFAGTSLLIERLALRHNQNLYRKVAWLNLTVAAGLGVTATYNLRLR